MQSMIGLGLLHASLSHLLNAFGIFPNILSNQFVYPFFIFFRSQLDQKVSSIDSE